jgi:hypothetical protein
VAVVKCGRNQKKGSLMEKLKFFKFNSLRWQYRKFPYLEIKYEIKPDYLLLEYLEPFGGLCASKRACMTNLCRMIGLDDADVDLYAFLMTASHFVDAEGVAWPEDTIVVLQKVKADEAVCFLVSPKPRV